MDIGELKRFAAEIGEPEYRAEQIMSWLIRGAEIQEMTNLPLRLRERLSETAETGLPRIKRRLVSRLDGTVKYLFMLEDGQCVEHLRIVAGGMPYGLPVLRVNARRPCQKSQAL